MQTNKVEIAFNAFPVLHTDRLDLVEINQSHTGDIFKLFSDEQVTKFYNIVPFKEESEAKWPIELFQNRFTAGSGLRWGIALKGRNNIIGTVGFNNFTRRHRANIGYDLQSDQWKKGYMSEALSAVVDFGFKRLELNRIEAEVMTGNTASEKVLGKLNFRNEGILRQWLFWNDKYYDMTMFSLLKDDYERLQTTV